MNIQQPDWPQDAKTAIATQVSEGIALQHHLAPQITTKDDFSDIKYITGVDAGSEDGGTLTRAAAAVVLSFPALELVEMAIAHLQIAQR